MKEVSCKALGIFVRDLKRTKRPLTLLTQDTPVTIEHIQNPRERVDWETYRAIMANVSRLYTRDELVELGGAFFRDPIMRPISMLARVLFEPKDFYKWMGKAKEGAGDLLFTCVLSNVVERGPHEVAITLTLAPGYEPCEAFYHVSFGALRDAPRLFSLVPAKVTMSRDGAATTYVIEIPEGAGLLRRLRRWLLAPLAARAVANELEAANGVLEQRYRMLEAAKLQLNEQAAQLQLAYQVGQVIHGDLDLGRTMDAIVNALVQVAGCEAARIKLSTYAEGVSVELERERGSPSTTSVSAALPIEIRGERVGVLETWASAARSTSDSLAYVLPTISMAIDDALTFKAVADYRINLERKVEERTAELQEARDSLAGTVQRLEEAQAARDRFFANINHEIRTPLSLVLLAAADIRKRDGAGLSERSRGGLSNIERAVERLLGLVDSLLLLAASQEGKLRLRPQERDLATEVRQIVSSWVPAASENRVHLHYTGPQSCVATLDYAAVERVLSNLVSNAIKFTPNGGTVEVRLSPAGARLQLSVADTGIGLEEEFKRRIFGRFEQGRAAVRRGTYGSGIGLAIVRDLVEAHGGNIEARDNPGGGALFVIDMPTKIEAQSTQGAFVARQNVPAAAFLEARPEAARPVVFTPPQTAVATVLIAEDDDALRAEVAALLTDRYKVIVAADGASALRMAEEHLPDLLVSDVGMPGMDGLELSRRFRALSGNRLAPVILLTAYAQPADLLAGFEAGAIDYVTKPFQPEELLARVRSQLALRTLALRLSQSEKLASLGVLSAGLAHEMRNPANALVNAIEPLLETLPSELKEGDAPAAQLLEVIRDCSLQLARLSRQLLGFTRPGDLQVAATPLDGLVRRALAIVERPLRGIKTMLQLDYAADVVCAGPMMVQVLVNLLENAAHAAGPGGWIKVRAQRTDTLLVIEIGDSGPGVPPELRERVFEPFFTTKPPGEGTGLGLSTSRQIVEQHRGTLRVADGPSGAVFRIELPVGELSSMSHLESPARAPQQATS